MISTFRHLAKKQLPTRRSSNLLNEAVGLMFSSGSAIHGPTEPYHAELTGTPDEFGRPLAQVVARPCALETVVHNKGPEQVLIRQDGFVRPFPNGGDETLSKDRVMLVYVGAGEKFLMPMHGSKEFTVESLSAVPPVVSIISTLQVDCGRTAAPPVVPPPPGTFPL